MPIYEYGCNSCGHTLEALQKLSDKMLRKCPECGKLALKRLMSAPAFRLKGGGWYETDFKSDAEKKRNIAAADGPKDDAKPKDGTKPKEDTKSKPDDKGGAKPSIAGAGKAAEKKSTKPSGKDAGGSAVA